MHEFGNVALLFDVEIRRSEVNEVDVKVISA